MKVDLRFCLSLPRRGFRTYCILAAAMAAGVASAELPRRTPEIRKSHPRLFFNSDTWPSIKAYADGAAKSELTELLRRCDTFPTNPVCSGTEAPAPGWPPAIPLPHVKEWGVQASMCALAWRFTGERRHLEKAKRMLAVSVAAYGEAYQNRRAVNWYSNSRILALCAYDWIFEALTPEERRDIIVPLVQHVEDVQPGEGRPAIVRRNYGDPYSGFYGVQTLLWYSGVAADGDGFCDGLARSHLQRGYDVSCTMLAFRDKVSGDDGALASGVVGYSMGEYPWAHFNFFHTLASAAGVDAASEYPNLALFPNWIWWNWIPTRAGAGHCGFGDAPHDDNLLPVGRLYEHMTQYANFYRKSSPAAARLAVTLRRHVSRQSLGGTWPMYPFLFADVDGIEPFSDEELDSWKLKARHFESIGQFAMRSGWNADATYCMFTSGGDVDNHRHYDENNFVIYRNGYQALDSGSRARQTDHNLTYYYAQTVAHNCVLIHKPNEPLTSYWGLKYDGPEGRFSYGGQCKAKGTPIAFETNPLYTYVAADATRSYGSKCSEAVRQFVYIMPDVFVVYDRVGATDPSYAKEWLLHMQNEPDVDGCHVKSQAEGGMMHVRTLLPESGSIEKIGGPGREFWSAGRNWPLDEDYVKDVKERCARRRTGPWFGQWRIAVKPGKPSADDRFLHVINVGDASNCEAVASEYVKGASSDGVRMSIRGQQMHGKTGTLEVTLRFNRTGAVGGDVCFRLIGNDGECLAEENAKLAEKVAAQSGVL